MRRPDVIAAGDASIAVGGNLGAASTTHIGTQVLGVSAMPVAAAARDPQGVYTAVGLDRFTGRGWLADQVDRFMAANPCGYVFIEAEAGLGKTTFAAWLVSTRRYLSHFSRYAGGRSARVALQNLSAQLITSFGLDELAPGRMLPEWAQTPGGFESLLGIAAGRARQDGRDLVLVVDGLDEAEPHGDGLPFGLPGLLPDGVYVVGTYRAGRSPGRPDTPAATIRIGKDDPRNRGDIGEYLFTAVAEEVLAARLAEAGVDPAEFTAVLAARCDGVWVYLRYVVDEVRIGLRHPGAVADLPTGLRDYYADQIRRWQRDPAWDSGLLPLAATLAVAGEPLPAVSLARLAGGLDPVVVRRWCDFTFRPLLTTSQVTTAALPQRYEIYHASFREVLKAHHHPPGLDGYQPSDAAALADELAQATITAHRRIADTYLACFGGLDTGLSALADDPSGGDADGGYPLRHLARHLQHAGRSADLHRLLAADQPAGQGRRVNVWFAAHDHADCVNSYLDDLARASSDCALATGQALKRHQPAASLGTQIRYALMAASIVSRTTSISVELLEQVVRTGLWSPARGLDHARRLTDPRIRLDALVTVHPHLAPDEQNGVLAEALTSATAITDDYARARALTDLAPGLPAELISHALTAATAITDDYARARALTDLAPGLPAEDQPAVLAQALAAATAVTDDYARARALTDLAAGLPAEDQPAVLAQALATATAISSDDARARALTELASRLPAEDQPAVLAQALGAATAITDDDARAEVLTELASRLPAEDQPAVLAQALAAATAITYDYARARALTALAPRLPAELIPQALTAAIAIDTDYAQVRALTGLGPRLPAVLAQALAVATAISSDDARARALTELAPRLPAEDQPAVLAQALAVATAITNDSSRARALTDLAPRLPAEDQPAVLAQALAAATAITHDYYYRARAQVSLASHLTADEQSEALAQALAAATAVPDDYYRAVALSDLAPYLPADEQSEALAEALAAATPIISSYARARALTDLASGLPVEDQPAVLAQALAAAIAITDDYARARALTDLAPGLPVEDQPAVLAQALAAAIATTDDYARALALADLAPRLPAELIPDALAAATAISSDAGRARALTDLAPCLPVEDQPAVLAQALAAAIAITDDYARARALTDLAPRLPADRLADALAAAPRTTADPLTAVLERGRQVLLPLSDGDREWLELLTNAMNGTGRVTCFMVIEAVAPAIARIGGEDAVLTCVNAIEDVHQWWP